MSFSSSRDVRLAIEFVIRKNPHCDELTLSSNMPGVQFYTANYLGAPLGKTVTERACRPSSCACCDARPASDPPRTVVNGAVRCCHALHGKAGAAYNQFGGFCLETQYYPDTPNQQAFPSSTLQPGQVGVDHQQGCAALDQTLSCMSS
jgi:galactose mutarotase-like enzyme